ncbi:MAG: hypothetical protein WA667_14715, partial [Candidatus Nitrosopolaris sp.]
GALRFTPAVNGRSAVNNVISIPKRPENIPKDHVKIVFEQMQLIMPKKDIEEQWSRLKEYMDVYLRHHAIPMIYNTK